MRQSTIEALNQINRRFYAGAHREFSRSRRRAWSGWTRLLTTISPPDGPLRVLDVACGNGRFARFLAANVRGHIDYLGLDSSQPLLAECAQIPQPSAGSFAFESCDLVQETLTERLGRSRFDWVVLFGTLHHIPGHARRAALLGQAARLLAPDGRLVFTIWRFAEQERFRRRFLPWRQAEPLVGPIEEKDLEPGDHLLAWGPSSDPRLRYCHDTSPAEERALLAQAGLIADTCFEADGREQRLNRYVIASIAD